MVAYTERSTSLINNKQILNLDKVVLLPPTLNADKFIRALWNKESQGSTSLNFIRYEIVGDDDGLFKQPKGVSTRIEIKEDIRTSLIKKFKKVAEKIKKKSPLSYEEQFLINASPLPVVDILNIQAVSEFQGDSIYEFIAFLAVESFVSEIFSEFIGNINAVQGLDVNFSSEYRDDLVKFNYTVSKVQEMTRALLSEKAEAMMRDNEQVDAIRQIIFNFYRMNDTLNYNSGR